MKFSKEMLEILDIEDKYDSLVKSNEFIKKYRRLRNMKLKSKKKNFGRAFVNK